MLVEKFLDYIKVEKRYSVNTLKAYDFDLNEFTTFLEEQNIDSFQKVNLKELRLYVAHLNEKNIKAVTINRKISVLKKFFGFIYEIKEIENNPSRDLRFLKPEKNIEPPLSDLEIKELLDIEFDRTDIGEFRDYLIIRLLFFTGMRRTELITLNINSIDLQGNIIKVLGKGNKMRQIPISPKLSEILKEYIEKVKNKFDLRKSLFYTNKGKLIYPEFVYKLTNNYLSVVTSKKKKSPHVMRHSFATQLMKKGVDINSLKELMGHSAISSTERYTHYNIEELKEVYNHSHPREKNN